MPKYKTTIRVKRGKTRKLWERSPVETVIESKKRYNRKTAKQDFYKIADEIDKVI